MLLHKFLSFCSKCVVHRSVPNTRLPVLCLPALPACVLLLCY